MLCERRGREKRGNAGELRDHSLLILCDRLGRPTSRDWRECNLLSFGGGVWCSISRNSTHVTGIAKAIERLRRTAARNNEKRRWRCDNMVVVLNCNFKTTMGHFERDLSRSTHVLPAKKNQYQIQAVCPETRGYQPVHAFTTTPIGRGQTSRNKNRKKSLC